MDCLCCENGGEGPPSETEFLGSLCQLKLPDGTDAKFPIEPERYTLYVAPGCPFAARPWTVLGFYGLTENGAVRLCKCFPASYKEWFFEPVSDGEKALCNAFPDAQHDKEPHHGCTHLRQLYEIAKPGFTGVVSVPLLWDAKADTAVSNSSLGLAEMISNQMRFMGTRNKDVELFPCSCKAQAEYKEHNELVKWLHANVTTSPYNVVASTGPEQSVRCNAYYKTLDEIQQRLALSGPYLMGNQIRFADLLLWISLVRLDLAYQWRFGLGRRNIRENYPVLWDYVKRIMALPGMAGTVLPRELMAQYFMSTKWVQMAGQILPQVPETWFDGCMAGNCSNGDV